MKLPHLRDFPSILRRSTSGSTFLPVVDGLRFLAILPVVVQHLSERAIRISEARHLATPRDYAFLRALPTGQLGVELFFVISGLIISHPFIRAHFQQTGMPKLKAFYSRRVTRLEPPYLLVMLGCYMFVRLTGYVPEGTLAFARSHVSLEKSLVASLTYMHGLLIGTTPILNPPAWSLEIEIQFYIIAPLLLLAFFRLRRPIAILAALVLFMLGTIVASHLLKYRLGNWHTFLVTRFLYLFATGMLINVLSFGGLVPRNISRRLWDIGFVASAIVLYVIDRRGGPMLTAGLQSICYVVLFLGAFNGDTFKEFLSRPWIFATGGMCYTIYLIHLPILHVLTGIAMRTTGLVSFMPGLILSMFTILPILFVASVLFYLLIEKPCMNPKWPMNLWQWSRGLIRAAGVDGR
jgi:peptidoglycan/LPS O-acetylase OafA/YrhL